MAPLIAAGGIDAIGMAARPPASGVKTGAPEFREEGRPVSV